MTATRHACPRLVGVRLVLSAQVAACSGAAREAEVPTTVPSALGSQPRAGPIALASPKLCLGQRF